MTKFHRYSTSEELPSDRNANEKSRRRTRHPLVIRLVVGIVVVASGIGYLFAVNSVSTQGFRIKELHTRIETLSRENEKMEIRIARLQSGEQIQEAAARMKLVEVQNVRYLEPASSVALGE